MPTESEQTSAAHPLLRLTEQDPEITTICEDEIEVIRAEISPARAYIYHVGSTAVPGLHGKPAIDLLMSPVKWQEAETKSRKWFIRTSTF